MDDIKEQIRRFILDEYLPGEAPENLTDDLPLRSSGVLDSLATLGVARFVEKQFDVMLEARDTGVETFDCIEDIAALVARKRAGA